MPHHKTVLTVILGIELSIAVSAQERPTNEVQVLNYLTHAVAGIYEGIPPQEVREQLIANIRHDAAWTTASRLIEQSVKACSEGEALLKQIDSKNQNAEEIEQAAKGKQILSTTVALASGAALPWLSLLGSTSSATSIRLREQAASSVSKWGDTLAQLSLELERQKETLRKSAGLPQSAIVLISHARACFVAIRKLESDDEQEMAQGRRSLLRLTRSTDNYPQLQFALATAYTSTSPSRADRYFAKAIAQSGDYLTEDTLSGFAAIHLAAKAWKAASESKEPSERAENLEVARGHAMTARAALPNESAPILMLAAIQAKQTQHYGDLIDTCTEVLEVEENNTLATRFMIEALDGANTKASIGRLHTFIQADPSRASSFLETGFLDGLNASPWILNAASPNLIVRWEEDGAREIPVLENRSDTACPPFQLLTKHSLAGESVLLSVDVPSMPPQSSMTLDELFPVTHDDIRFLQNAGNKAGIQQDLAVRQWKKGEIWCYGPFGLASVHLNPRTKFLELNSPEFLGEAFVQITLGSAEIGLQKCKHQDASFIYVNLQSGELDKHSLRIIAKQGTTTLFDETRWLGLRGSVRLRLPEQRAGLPDSKIEVQLVYGTDQATATLDSESSLRSFEIYVVEASVSKDDFKENEGTAPDLYVKMRGADKTNHFSNAASAKSDSFVATWPRAANGWKFQLTPSDELELELWDSDIASDDRLVHWSLDWEKYADWHGKVTIKSMNGSKLTLFVVTSK